MSTHDVDIGIYVAMHSFTTRLTYELRRHIKADKLWLYHRSVMIGSNKIEMWASSNSCAEPLDNKIFDLEFTGHGVHFTRWFLNGGGKVEIKYFGYGDKVVAQLIEYINKVCFCFCPSSWMEEKVNMDQAIMSDITAILGKVIKQIQLKEDAIIIEAISSIGRESCHTSDEKNDQKSIATSTPSQNTLTPKDEPITLSPDYYTITSSTTED